MGLADNPSYVLRRRLLLPRNGPLYDMMLLNVGVDVSVAASYHQ